MATMKKPGPLVEIGSAGLKVASGYVYEEYLPELVGPRGMKTFAKMRDQDATIGALLAAADLLCRRTPWRVEPADESAEGQQGAEFLEGVMEDMSHTWEDFISEAMTMLVFGWSYCEIVLKRRIGPEEQDPSRRSRFTDGAIGIRKLAPRAQESLERWEMQDDGGIAGWWQTPPQSGGTIFLPIERGLLFRTVSRKNNPEGRSILRNAYRSWFLMTTLENVEGIGIERELAGLPVVSIPAHYLTSTDPKDIAVKQAYEKIAKQLKFNEQGGLVIPSDTYRDAAGSPTAVRQVTVELLSTGGQRTIDPDVAIRRHQGNIARSALADFLILGQDSAGSFAMSESKTSLFLKACQTFLNTIAQTFNRHGVPRLYAYNGWPQKALPKALPNEVVPADLDALGKFLTALSGAGATLFPDENLEKHLRAAAGLPEPSEEDLAAAREAAEAMREMGIEGARSQLEGGQEGGTEEDPETEPGDEE